jgi:hypothetical protein
MTRPRRLELATLCLENESRCAISPLFLGSAFFLNHDFTGYSGILGPGSGPYFEFPFPVRAAGPYLLYPNAVSGQRTFDDLRVIGSMPLAECATVVQLNDLNLQSILFSLAPKRA